MKKAKEWYKDITCPYLRARALNNLDKDNLDDFVSLKEAIGRGFDWVYTPEGYNFWQVVHYDSYYGGVKTLRKYRKFSIEKVN
jgi:hypothetical protein